MTQEEKEAAIENLKEELAGLWDKLSETNSSIQDLTYRKVSLESTISAINERIDDLKQERFEGMTRDEVEAYKIADRYPMPPSTITPSDAKAMIRNGALQMAEWKDMQFIKFLEDTTGDHQLALQYMESAGIDIPTNG